MMRFIVLMIALMVLTFIFCTCKDAPTKPKDGNTDTTSHNIAGSNNYAKDNSFFFRRIYRSVTFVPKG